MTYQQAHICPDCRGPSLFYRGDVHRWRCAACIRVHIGLDLPTAADRVPLPIGPIKTTCLHGEADNASRSGGMATGLAEREAKSARRQEQRR